MYTNEQIERQKLADTQLLNKCWAELEKSLSERSDPETAKKIRAAFEDCYSGIYQTDDVIAWVANLYSPEHGGFYYSNSARDNEGFLPDIESTKQAMDIIPYISTDDELGNTPKDFYPDWIKKQIVCFLKQRQNENGYFYHPQWAKEFTDTKHNRRGRDLAWACRILEDFGGAPTYDTPIGVRGNGILWDGTPAPDYTPSVSEKNEPAAPKEEFVTPHLKDKESFLEYLSTFDLNGACYSTGNTFESQANQILARDVQLKKMGADYSLCEILADWFNRHQNPDTGLWTLGDEITQTGINGLLKISSTYNRIKQPIPNAEKGISSAIKLIESGYNAANICAILNPWGAISMLFQNAEKYSVSNDEQTKEKLAEYEKYLFEHSVDMIHATKNLLVQFKKPDGSYSMLRNSSSWYSQEHPVAIPNTDEGDVNATVISLIGIIGNVFNLLKLKRIPVFTGADKMKYLNMLEESANIEK